MKHNSSLNSGLKDGDYASYKVLFEKCYGKLLSFTKSLIKDEQAADDIVQEQFMKLWNNRQNIEECMSVESYLYVMTKNAALNYMKSRRKYAGIPQDGCSDISLPEMEETIDLNIFRDKLAAIIDAMPPQRRKVFIMSRIKGMSNITIAETLGLSVKTVDRHLALAKSFIKENMSSYYIS